MSLASLPIATLLLLATAFAQYPGPPSKAPLRNTFVTATESVLDQATALDLNADAAAFDPGMATLKTAEQNLEALAADDQEQAVIDSLKNMLFDISSCRIQAVDGTDISPCLHRITAARTRTLETIHKHKVNNAWVDGDPTP